MAGRQTARILITGMSGGGKSFLGKEIIRAMRGRYRQLVIVNRKREFSEFCEKAFIVDEEGDPARALRRYRRVFFQVDGYDPRPFLDNLGQALMKRHDVFLVVDEAWEFFQRGRVPKSLFRVITGGRELGHNTLMMTQMLQSASGGIDLGVIQQSTHVAMLRMVMSNDIERAKVLFPELGEKVAMLKRPENGLPPELAVRGMLTGEAAVGLRDPANPRRRIWKDLTAKASAEPIFSL